VRHRRRSSPDPSGRSWPCSQKVLKTGFGYAGAIDGVFGPVTAAVVRQYQTNSGLPVTGVVDERTWMAPAGAAGATLESLSSLKL
jgi:peptidoglycan hydrolase-like protein with peptidoglycan-binding domain